MGDPLAGGFRIGDHRVEPNRGRIVSHRGEVRVEPRAMDVLVALAGRPGDTVSRDDLILAVWKHPHVTDEALSRCISVLRHALGDDRSQSRLIETIPKRGYRLAVPVKVDGASAPGRSALAAPDWSKTNLTLPLTRIIGRASAIEEVRELLAEQRLVTLTGSAGVGKTRLALEAGRQALSSHADGVWLVELASLSDPTLIPSTIAMLLGIKLGETASPAKELSRRIGSRDLTLILDNCEHLIEAVATFAETVLGTAPGVRILATSQVLINIAGEQAYRVASLDVPRDDQRALAEIMTAPAVELFVERAKAADSRFPIDSASAGAIAAICRRLDGIPLAIEMAAARAPVLGVDQIASLLDERFRLLTGGRRTALPRQQTLRATLDWSYELLSARERVVLARLGVFAGGFTIEAASAVASDDAIDKLGVIDVLGRLIARSLVVADSAERGKRYRLLQSTRDYALERLDESGESDATRSRHLDFFLQLAEEVSPNNWNAAERTLFDALHLERENFLAACAWCDRAPDKGQAALRLAFALKDYWVHRGGLEPGYRVTVDALEHPGARQRDRVRARALYTAALLGTCLGRHGEVLGFREECLAIARELADEKLTVFALLSLGEHFCLQRQWQAARRAIEEAAAKARQQDPGSALYSASMALGDLDRIQGDFAAAESRYIEALAVARAASGQRGLVVALLDLASVAVARGSAGKAPPLLLEALSIVEAVDSKPIGSVALLVASGLAASLERWQDAAELHGAAARQSEEAGYRYELADEMFIAPLIARAREALGETGFAEGAAAGQHLAYDAAIGRTISWLQTLPMQ